MIQFQGTFVNIEIYQWIEYLNDRVHLGQQCQQYTKVIKTSKYN